MTDRQTTWVDYDYAVIRVVPQVHLCAFINVGVILHARTAGYLAGRFHVNRSLFASLCPHLDLDLLGRYLDAYTAVCAGGPDAGPIGLLPPSERFHWLTAPRSAVLQASEVHGGLTPQPEATLDHLFAEYVIVEATV